MDTTAIGTTEKLYIIGNGFDLHHKIPSKYSNFKKYSQLNDKRLFDAIDKYIPVKEDWRDFESSLANIDIEEVISDLSHFMPNYDAEDWSDAGHHDFQHEVEQVVHCLSTGLRKQFSAWVRTLTIPTPSTAPTLLKTIDVDANFLTFNYTSTLQSLYGVPEKRILHIHGQQNLQDSELVLGHAWNPQERQSLNNRPDIEDIDTRLTEANNILDDYFSRTFKPSGDLISKNKNFFDKLIHIDVVYVLGHSLSEVDEIYIHELLKLPNISKAQWIVAYKEENDCLEKRKRLIELGIDEHRAVLVQLTDL